jgi:pimeloyl-ACP methyl ester carboxylesterase
MKYFISLYVLFVSISAFSYDIGNYSDTFIDVERDNREIDVEVFYPINDSPGMTFPVMIFGHGWLMNFGSYSFLTEQLVMNGVIVVFPETESGVFPNHLDFASDIAFLEGVIQLDNNDQSSNLFNIVMDKTFAAGHSMGGGSSILASSFGNTFSGLINFAAAETDPSAIDAAENVNCPSIIFSANDDNIAPAGSNQLPMYENLASTNKYYINIFNEGHMDIASNLNVPIIIFPFIEYVISNDESNIEILNAKLDSLQVNNSIEYEAVNNVTSVENSDIINKYFLSNYPNPFNPTTTIEFSIANNCNVDLSIYNLKGQKVKALTRKNLVKGPHLIVWDGNNEYNKPVSSGVYYYKLSLDGKTVEMKKCTILK